MNCPCCLSTDVEKLTTQPEEKPMQCQFCYCTWSEARRARSTNDVRLRFLECKTVESVTGVVIRSHDSTDQPERTYRVLWHGHISPPRPSLSAAIDACLQVSS